MKKFISIMISGIGLAFAICDTVAAQPFDRYLTYSGIKTYQFVDYAVPGSGDNGSPRSNKEILKDAKTNLKASKASLKALEANVRSSENFTKEFKDVPEPTWTVLKNGINASFIKDGIKIRVDYNRKGRWVQTLTYFPPDRTPENIRQTIRFDYPNATINLAVQVLEGNMDFYIVELEDKTTYKQVAVLNDETILVRELRKAH